MDSATYSNKSLECSEALLLEAVPFGREFDSCKFVIGLFVDEPFEEWCAWHLLSSTSFLSYELLSQVSGELKVGDLSTTEKELSHKISLNLGKKFKYGLYYLSKTQSFSGDLSYYRNSQSIGAYIGYAL